VEIEEGDLGQRGGVHMERGGVASGAVGQVVDEGGLGPHHVPGPENPGSRWLLVHVVGHDLDRFTVDDGQDTANATVIMGGEA